MLKDDLKEDLKNALKNRDSLARSVLGMLMTAIQNKELNKRSDLEGVTDPEELKKQSELSDEEVLRTIASEVKKRKDAKEQFEKGNRPELAEKELKEIEILAKYLPEQLGEEEVRKIVEAAIAQTGASGPGDMGKVMGASMKDLKGKADGNLVQKIVKELLN